MATAPATDWRAEFGIQDWTPPTFFARKEDIDAAGQATPQAHALRRAFETMQLDGIVCFDRTPVVYFKKVPAIDPAQVFALLRQFWNQGLAPILALIDPQQVHVYSGLTAPVNSQADVTQPDCLVTTLERTTAALQTFLISVESGDFFRAHAHSFDPKRRVDRDLLRNLQAAREELAAATSSRLDPKVLDALLCRLVFTCYLFDREVIGPAYLEDLAIPSAGHLRDILGRQPKTEAKAQLYRLFAKLGEDFNGDLFSDDLDKESALITAKHLGILATFFQAADVRTGQQTFWPYDFSVIPIETISAIYEHFLKAADAEAKKEAGAFYTPRFLAEVVLDAALEGCGSLLDKRFLDPACGSGIFLVGLFNRLAGEWKRFNPKASYHQQVKGLLKILRENLCGVDSNETACRITAFSLYLAFLDQFFPRDIQELQRRGKVLPRLVRGAGKADPGAEAAIACGDFFDPTATLPTGVDLVVGNPPWASAKDKHALVTRWCAERELPFPDRQLATAFVWKAAEHLRAGGKVCFVLPHGTLFNHGTTALAFQRSWMQRHAVELVLNLADYQRFLFEESEAPALVVRYRKERAADSRHWLDYWAPKTEWKVTQAEIISILPQDRTRLTVREVLDDLRGPDAPLIWKERFWATPRDWRLLDRLSLLPRLRDLVGQPSRREGKRWLIAEGFQPLGENDDPAKGKTIHLPTRKFIEASAGSIRLILLSEECDDLPDREITLRSRSNTNTEIFRAPHVLVTQGFSQAAYADFDVTFRHAVRGIHGPEEDRDLLIFLTAYLRSALARFYLFHTSSNWGVSRAKIHVEELLRLPFPLPDQQPGRQPRCRQIVREVARIVTQAAGKLGAELTDREGIIVQAQAEAEKLVEEYFDIDSVEKMLIEDTNKLIIPSVRPTRKRVNVPTIQPSSTKQREAYTQLLCDTLNSWAKGGEYQVSGRASANPFAGVGLVVLEKLRRGETPKWLDKSASDILATLHELQKAAVKSTSSFELVQGLKVFHKNLLYVIKPVGQRFWTRTAALNDADEIAATILTRSGREGA